MNPTPPPEEAKTPWPASSMLFLGTFGSQTPAGRRYHNRCLAASGLLIMAIVLIGGFTRLAGLPLEATFPFTAALPGVVSAVIAWEFRRYINSLDELARRIQLEAATWTYLTGMVAAIFLWGYSVSSHTPLPAYWPALYITLEPIRGVWLYFVSRKY